MDKYESLSDVSPHQENIILITPPGDRTFDDTKFRSIFREIIDRVQSIPGEELEVVPHYDGYQRIEKFSTLLPHSVWVVNYTVLSGENKNDALAGKIKDALPNSTEVYICVDPSEETEDVDGLSEEYPFAELIRSQSKLVTWAYRYFSFINPRVCDGSKEYILKWNNQVYNQINNYG